MKGQIYLTSSSKNINVKNKASAKILHLVNKNYHIIEMTTKTIDNYTISFSPNGILRLEIMEKSELTRKHIKEYFRAVEKYFDKQRDQPPYLLAVMHDSFAISFPAMMEARNNPGAKKLAIVTHKKRMRGGLSLAVRIVKLKFPVQFFDNEADAKSWLLSS